MGTSWGTVVPADGLAQRALDRHLGLDGAARLRGSDRDPDSNAPDVRAFSRARSFLFASPWAGAWAAGAHASRSPAFGALEIGEDPRLVFDYTAPAELFIAKRSGGPRAPLGYRRFASAAEAIRFAVEELPAGRILGAFMQIGDLRFDSEGIRSLYDCEDYPLRRARS
jgi:hypothetical protein